MDTQITQEVEQTTPQTQNQLINQALVEVNKAKDIVIVTTDDYSFAALVYKNIKMWIQMLDDEEKKITKPLLTGIEAARALFRGPKQMANDVKNILNTRMVSWAEDQERLRRDEERRLQEEARKRAEEDALTQALEAEAAGETFEAEEIIKEIYVPPVKVASSIPKSKESHIRETWSAELISLKDLVEGIVAGNAPLMAVTANMTFLNEQARSYKQAMSIAGCRAVSKKTQI